MDDRELGKLSYLCQALVSAPHWHRQILDMVANDKDGIRFRIGLIPPSPDLKMAIESLRKAFSVEFKSSYYKSDARARLRRIAAALSSSKKEPAQEAGRSILWCLENLSPRKRTCPHCKGTGRI